MQPEYPDDSVKNPSAPDAPPEEVAAEAEASVVGDVEVGVSDELAPAVDSVSGGEGVGEGIAFTPNLWDWIGSISRWVAAGIFLAGFVLLLTLKETTDYYLLVTFTAWFHDYQHGLIYALIVLYGLNFFFGVAFGLLPLISKWTKSLIPVKIVAPILMGIHILVLGGMMIVNVFVTIIIFMIYTHGYPGPPLLVLAFSGLIVSIVGILAYVGSYFPICYRHCYCNGALPPPFLERGREILAKADMGCWFCASLCPACLYPAIAKASENVLQTGTNDISIKPAEAICPCGEKCGLCCPFFGRMIGIGCLSSLTLIPIWLLLYLVAIIPVWGWGTAIGFSVIVTGVMVYYAASDDDEWCMAPTKWVYGNFCEIFKQSFCVGAVLLVPFVGLCFVPLSIAGATHWLKKGSTAPNGKTETITEEEDVPAAAQEMV